MNTLAICPSRAWHLGREQVNQLLATVTVAILQQMRDGDVACDVKCPQQAARGHR